MATSFPLGTVGLLCALSVWVARITLRFGWVPEIGVDARRRWLEHLEASAAFRWRHGRVEDVLAELRADVERRAARALPGYRGASLVSRETLLATHAGMSRSVVHEAMGPLPVSRRELVRSVRALQELRRKL